jgi:hypothetical protein
MSGLVETGFRGSPVVAVREFVFNDDVNKPLNEMNGWSEAQWFREWLELANRS